MKKAVFTSWLIVLATFGFFALSSAPVYIAILDSPIDFHHTQISEILDEDLLRNVSITDKNGDEKSWYEINQAARAEFEKRIDQGRYQEQIHFLDSLNAFLGKNRSKAEAKQAFKGTLSGLLKYVLSPKFRTGLKLVGNYIHGTHVAGIMVRSLTNIRLISFPVVTANNRLKASEIIKFDSESHRQETRLFLNNISRVLKANHVRVVNMSVATSKKIAFKSLSQRASFLQKTMLRPWLKNLAQQSATIFFEELDRLIQENPQSVFVLAAGNEKTVLTKESGHTATLTQPNLVKVAAVNEDGKIASFSNKSSEWIDIAALGIAVPSALINGGRIRLSGTSQAAPAVANALAQIFEQNPSMSSEEAIHTLLSQKVFNKLSLSEHVALGRMLRIKADDLIKHSCADLLE